MALQIQGFLQVLRIRDYRLLWAAQLVSVIGDWILTAALLVFAYRLTGRADTVAVMIISEALPVLLLGYLVGTLSDCLNRKRVMVVSDLARAGMVLVLLLVSSKSQIWVVYLVVFVAGYFSLFFRPARAASIPNLVPEELLTTANSLATLNETVGMMIGSAIGGALASRYIGTAILLDSFTFLVSAGFLWMANIPQERYITGFAHVSDLLGEIGKGFKFIVYDKTVRSLLFVMVLTGIGVGAYNVLEVPLAKTVLGLSDRQFGYMLSSAALGMLIGSFIAGGLVGQLRPRMLLVAGIIVLGGAIIGFSRASGLHTAQAALVAMGIGSAVSITGCTTLFQISTPNLLQGRAVALFWMAYTSVNLAATYAASRAAEHVGTRAVLLGCGVLMVVSGTAALFLIRERRQDSPVFMPEEDEPEAAVAG